MIGLIAILLALSLLYWLVVALGVPQPFRNIFIILIVLAAIWYLLKFGGLV